MYEATIVHHSSIARARSVRAKSLAAIKRKASSEFSGEFIDYEIVIYDMDGPHGPLPVASRRVGGRRWSEYF